MDTYAWTPMDTWYAAFFSPSPLGHLWTPMLGHLWTPMACLLSLLRLLRLRCLLGLLFPNQCLHLGALTGDLYVSVPVRRTFSSSALDTYAWTPMDTYGHLWTPMLCLLCLLLSPIIALT